MSPRRRLTPVPARKVLKILQDAGFERVGQKGSHVKLRSPGGVILVVPNHPGQDLKVALLRALLRQAGMGVEEFLERL